MSTFYSQMADTASRLITQFGQSITIKRNTGGSVHPVTGVVTAGTTASLTAKGILKAYPDNLIDGTRITKSDRMLILDDSQVPVMTDKITVQSQDWNIEDITTSNPAGVPLVYFVQVRK